MGVAKGFSMVEAGSEHSKESSHGATGACGNALRLTYAPGLRTKMQAPGTFPGTLGMERRPVLLEKREGRHLPQLRRTRVDAVKEKAGLVLVQG